MREALLTSEADLSSQPDITITAGYLTSRFWALSFIPGSIACAQFRFNTDMTIGNYKHPNESGWRLEGGIPCLLDQNGQVTVWFDSMRRKGDHLVLIGSHIPDPQIFVCLTEMGTEWSQGTGTKSQWTDEIRTLGWEIGDHTYGVPVIIEKTLAKLRIGKYVSIADGVQIALGDHRTDTVSSYPFVAPRRFWPSVPRDAADHTSKGDVQIGNDVWICAGALIVSGVTVGDGAVIGAASVVTRDVPPYAIVAGNPARVLRYRFSDVVIAELLALAWWNWSDEVVDSFLPLMMSNDIEAFLAATRRFCGSAIGNHPDAAMQTSATIAAAMFHPVTQSYDTAATQVEGVSYVHRATAADVSMRIADPTPDGASGLVPAAPLSVSAPAKMRALNVVFIGDSLTYGGGVENAGTALSPTAPYFAMAKLRHLLGIQNINAANQGLPGLTATDWAPGGAFYNWAVQACNQSSAASVLAATTPDAKMIFSITLGTNDSASSGTNNGGITGGLTASQFATRITAIIDQIIAVDWPDANIIVHGAPWYSVNFQNSATYLHDGLARLYSYRAAVAALVASYESRYPNQVFLGDTDAFDHFCKNHTSELQAESGPEGIFYCHPSGLAGANGLIGTQSLGEMWAVAIANMVYATKARDARG